MSDQKKCPTCLVPFESADVVAKIFTITGERRVHRHCVVIAEHEAAATALEYLADGILDLIKLDRYSAIVEQSRRRERFYRDHNEAMRQQQEAEANGSHTFGTENIVEAAAQECGYAGRERDWASEVLLREAQRVVYGNPAISAHDWEKQAKDWHARCANLRDAMASYFAQALTVKKPDMLPAEVQTRAAQHVEKIERGEQAVEDKNKIQIVQTMPKGIH